MRKLWAAVPVIALSLAAACTSPSAPSAPPPPPPPPVVKLSDPPEITCPASISTTAPFTGPAVVNYPAPSETGGENPVALECTPGPDAQYPIGTTSVECVATDALNRTASCSFAVTVVAPPRLSRSRILAFGDSITAGDVIVPNTDNLILEPAPATAYPTVLSQLLRERYGPQPAVFNAGLSGEKVAFADRRIAFEIGKFNANVVVLLEGYNDLLYADPIPAVQSVELGMSVAAAEARFRGARVFICTLSPTKPGRRQIPLATIQSANDRLRAVARGEGAYLIDVFSALLPDLNANLGTDGLHPSVLGYRRIAETVFAALRADLEIR